MGPVFALMRTWSAWPRQLREPWQSRPCPGWSVRQVAQDAVGSYLAFLKRQSMRWFLVLGACTVRSTFPKDAGPKLAA